ncbi:MAG TPA: glycosyltransferase, partial [Thermoanaerobaculia bacterium]|nr:glycosyltransferase [Thermoanaerobaculia bacterium]
MSAAPQAAATRRVLLAGGGSGGHVFPALAVGAELAARGWRVDFGGAAAGMEARLVGERGLPFHPLPARPLVGRGVVDRARALWTLAGSTLAARGLVRRLGVAVVVGTGGYVSAPAVLGAALAGVPAVLVEPNATPGVANRWLSRWAAEAALAFPEAADGFACPSTVTGVPVRGELAALPPAPIGGAVHLLVTGGSQGAEQLNRLLPAALGRLAAEGAAGRPPLAVLHQAGA